ncbi:MAG TPA: flagellar brake domain-containing protein, partial [Fimbriimonadaceae bacterium]|nr:flagellar brake domain-containing protein [Fimbriimonadaceae bacterium]
FGGTLLASYCIFAYFTSRRERFELPANTPVRLLGPGGAYRCHFLRRDEERLVFSSPIQADHYVPIRTGERLLVQAPGDNCLVSFRSEVAERDPDTHEIVLEEPEHIRRVERRTNKRSSALNGEDALLNGDIATLIDICTTGAAIITRRRTNPGERVNLVLPVTNLDTYGWALESSQAAFGIHPGYKVRIQFEEPAPRLAKIEAAK